ncbi:MAG: cadherin-like domain-containing protein [Gemmataceae bacterium]|nr:cadherin-like domain-containing protein [Gemmataceae bacterium]
MAFWKSPRSPHSRRLKPILEHLEARLTPDGTLNQAPFALGERYILSQDTSLTLSPQYGILANDADADGDTLTAQRSSDPANGSLSLLAGGSFTYTPQSGFSGTDSVTYFVLDGHAGSSTATAALTVLPRSAGDPYLLAGGGTLSFNDPAGTALGPGEHRLAHGNLTVRSDGSLVYTPDDGFLGTDGFTYTPSDGDGSPILVQLTVRPSNLPPSAAADNYSMSADTTLHMSVLGGLLANDRDADGDPLSLELLRTLDGLTLEADGSFTFTPANAGTYGFEYAIADGQGATSTAAVTITVLERTAGQPYTVTAGGSLSGIDLSFFYVPEGTYSTANGGTLIVNSGGGFTYTPNPDVSGGSDRGTVTYRDPNVAHAQGDPGDPPPPPMTSRSLLFDLPPASPPLAGNSFTAVTVGFPVLARSKAERVVGPENPTNPSTSTGPTSENQSAAGITKLVIDSVGSQIVPPPDLPLEQLPTGRGARPGVTATLAAFDPTSGMWYLRNAGAPGAPDVTPFAYGAANWVGLLGDWDGDGTITIGVFDPTTATFYLRNSNSPGAPDFTPFAYGVPGWLPLVGDWDGDGVTTIGVFDPSTATFYLRNSNSAGAPDIEPFAYGMRGWLPVVGDWNGDGTTTVSVVDPITAIWYLRNNNSPGAPDVTPFAYGMPGWVPVAGDWDGDGHDTIGMFQPGVAFWYLRNSNSAGGPDGGAFAYGMGHWAPVAGRWREVAGEAVLARDIGTGAPAMPAAIPGPIVAAARQILTERGADPTALDAISLGTTDLPGRQLGLYDGSSVWLDHDAAGHGWFIDSTPLKDEEFAQGQARAVARMDLLTVLLHELERALGQDFPDGPPQGGALIAGMRRIR